VDLIVVADWKEGFLDRIKQLLDMNSFNLPLEPIGYTEEEFERLAEDENPFILNALEEGKIIHEH
jgi:hypothetical protein